MSVTATPFSRITATSTRHGPAVGGEGCVQTGYNEGTCGGTIQLHDASMPGHGLMRGDIRTQQ